MIKKKYKKKENWKLLHYPTSSNDKVKYINGTTNKNQVIAK